MCVCARVCKIQASCLVGVTVSRYSSTSPWHKLSLTLNFTHTHTHTDIYTCKTTSRHGIVALSCRVSPSIQTSQYEVKYMLMWAMGIGQRASVFMFFGIYIYFRWSEISVQGKNLSECLMKAVYTNGPIWKAVWTFAWYLNALLHWRTKLKSGYPFLSDEIGCIVLGTCKKYTIFKYLP